MNQYELEGLWVSGSLSGVDYQPYDNVLIKQGKYAGEVAFIVALIRIDPAPVYVAELKTGDSVMLEQSDMERVA